MTVFGHERTLKRVQVHYGGATNRFAMEGVHVELFH